MRDLIRQTADRFAGAERRRLNARTVAQLDLGQRHARRLLGRGCGTIRKSLHEARSGTAWGATPGRGRRPTKSTSAARSTTLVPSV